MMRCSRHVKSHSGFTLVEIIVTLMLVGITAAIMFPVMGNNLIKSPEPVARTNNQYRLLEEMDKLTGVYRDEIDKESLNLSGFKTTYVDSHPLLDAANTQFVTSFIDNGGTYATQASDSILMVTLKLGDQRLRSLFTE